MLADRRDFFEGTSLLDQITSDLPRKHRNFNTIKHNRFYHSGVSSFHCIIGPLPGRYTIPSPESPGKGSLVIIGKALRNRGETFSAAVLLQKYLLAYSIQHLTIIQICGLHITAELSLCATQASPTPVYHQAGR